jgi:hypothetical protein
VCDLDGGNVEARVALAVIEMNAMTASSIERGLQVLPPPAVCVRAHARARVHERARVIV